MPRNAWHSQQLLAPIDQRQSATDEARHAAFIQQTLEITPASARYVDDFATLAITNLQRAFGRLADKLQLTIAR